jgi:hypothetical protein
MSPESNHHRTPSWDTNHWPTAGSVHIDDM